MHKTPGPHAHPAAVGRIPIAVARNAACLLGFCLLGFFAALYLSAPQLYFRLVSFFFFFDVPHDSPFDDLLAVMTSIECWQKGLHSYNGGGGGCVGFNYSPIWLRLGFMAKGTVPVPLAALALASAFLISMRYLPLQRTKRGLALMVLAGASSTSVFAIERANVDVLLYLFCFAGAACLSLHWPRRVWGYALFALAGFLKFYPIVLMGLALRERLPRALAIFSLLALAALAFYLAYHEEMRPVLGGVSSLNTHWGPFSDRFAARQLPDGIWLLMGNDAPPTAAALLPGTDSVNPKPPFWAVPTLTLMAVIAAFWQWRRADFRRSWDALTPREADFLLVGAIVVAGCFFAGYNIMYRAIFLLLALPGLIAMAAAAPNAFWRWLPLAVVYNLWAPTIQHLIQYAAKLTGSLYAGRLVITADWFGHELAWWWTMAAFIAVMLQLAATAPALGFLRAARGRNSAAPQAR